MKTIVSKFPKNIADARIEALEEAARHLDLNWTDDPEEKHQGTEVSHFLRQCAQNIYELSRE